MSKPYLHFTREEFTSRQTRVRELLCERQLDGLLLFQIEDMYWLTGLDTDGFYVFHCMYIGVDGELTYIARRVDRGNVYYSSVIDDYREWLEAAGSPRADTIKDMLISHGMQGKRIGIQLDSMGITAQLHLEIDALLNGWCELVPQSRLVSDLRLVKSEAELAYLRKAGQICDKLHAVTVQHTRSGVFEGTVFGKIADAIYANDGDPPALRNPMGCGDAAPLGRYVSGRKHMGVNDVFKFELGCGYRHYHAANFFNILSGPDVRPIYQRLNDAAGHALAEVQATARPGNTVGDLFEAHRRVYAEHGFEDGILFSCGYTMGVSFPPTWVIQPMIIRDAPLVLEPGMSLFTHMVAKAEDTSLGLGEQLIVTQGEPEIISHVPRNLVVTD
jgi:Xaa-Pro dipeptidase